MPKRTLVSSFFSRLFCGSVSVLAQRLPAILPVLEVLVHAAGLIDEQHDGGRDPREVDVQIDAGRVFLR
jgi:hypothetical protein